MSGSWVWPLVAAPFIGSFLSVVALRVHAPASIVVGRSQCRSCGQVLGARDLVPILSWVASGGRCRHCNGRVSAFYPGIELGALAVALWAAAVATGWGLWASCLLGWALLALAATDLRHYLLPDFLTLPLIAGGLVEAALLEPEMLGDRLAGIVIGAALVLVIGALYRRLRGIEGIGLGDAKLLAAAGAWVAWQGLPSVILIAAVAALAVLLPTAIRAGRMPWQRKVPFGAFLCFGLWIVWLYGPLGASW